MHNYLNDLSPDVDGTQPNNNIIIASMFIIHVMFNYSVDTWCKIVGTAVVVFVNVPNIIKTAKYLRNGAKDIPKDNDKRNADIT